MTRERRKRGLDTSSATSHQPPAASWLPSHDTCSSFSVDFLCPGIYPRRADVSPPRQKGTRSGSGLMVVSARFGGARRRLPLECDRQVGGLKRRVWSGSAAAAEMGGTEEWAARARGEARRGEARRGGGRMLAGREGRSEVLMGGGVGHGVRLVTRLSRLAASSRRSTRPRCTTGV